MKINWKQKLSSRKFWAAIVGFIAPVMIAFNYNTVTVEQTTAIITSAGVLIAYILAEGYADGKNKDGD